MATVTNNKEYPTYARNTSQKTQRENQNYKHL
jgi:hypothetical protein